MRTMTLEKIDKVIEHNRREANAMISMTHSSRASRRKKSRVRSKGEIECLNQISIARWNKAVSSGNIRKLGERVLYYDYN